ncbi:uncharacterized protein K460DRAFT_436368 [Cucurbitaria berberidis CBS 394.84]|uniref:Aminoglycoside phosphotransferase domain-containing protein n=1 Tax=Cucurbitaria berberidis CBS 394.84 TaxID=1168544 RepID=A0A9P4G8B7_9PLEO|nr:uncharacterized protein K460DRAFT_436368 [Cucurbitaria berberidis CBS 394.84]KAF1840885.1 hypothetical protein K460DRAFT_436368 [Cucurbitaria berberidis CBS 394.84]
MRSKTEILQEHFNVQTFNEAFPTYLKELASFPMPLSSWTKLQLPYEASSHPRIPSFDEIDRAMKEDRLKGGASSDVCKVGTCVVKMSYNPIILQEAEDLLFLQANSQVRTPTVYAVFARETKPSPAYYMVTEFIEGEMLTSKKWLSLSDKARTKICSKLCEQLRLLRSIPSEGYYGRVHNQGWNPNSLPLRSNGKEM